MKSLYYIFSQSHAAHIFFDEKADFVGYVHENDGFWTTYFDFIPKYFGGKVIDLGLEEDEDIGAEDGNTGLYIAAIRPEILKRINKQNKRKPK